MNNVPRTMNTVPRTNHPSCLSRRVPHRHLYICRGPSTNQLLFMQNKPNFQKAKMNINIYYTKVYNNETAFRRRKNKPNQTQFQMPTNPSSKERKKKGLRKFFWVSVAGKDILYGKSRFSLKFGESSFDCLSFRSLL